MKVSTKYNRVESMTFKLDVHDLRRAVHEFVERSQLWPKRPGGCVDIDFGDEEIDGRGTQPTCEVLISFTAPMPQALGEAQSGDARSAVGQSEPGKP